MSLLQIPTLSIAGRISGGGGGGSSSGMSPGATYYIQSTDTLQDGASFYVTQGTVNDEFTSNGEIFASVPYAHQYNTYGFVSKITDVGFPETGEFGLFVSSHIVSGEGTIRNVISWTYGGIGNVRLNLGFGKGELFHVADNAASGGISASISSGTAFSFGDVDNDKYIAIKSTPALSANSILILPDPTDASVGKVMKIASIDASSITITWGVDSTGGGGGTTINVQDGGSSIVDTSTMDFTGDQFVITDNGGDGLVTLNVASVTLLGQDLSASYLTTSSATAKYVQKSDQVTVIVPISAASLAGTVTSGGGPVATYETTTNKTNIDHFPLNQTTTSYFEFSYSMPNGWNEGTVTYCVVWTATESTGGVAFYLQGLCASNDDALDTAYGTAVKVTDDLITAGDAHVSAESNALTIGGTCAEGDYVTWRGYRDVADAADTLDARAMILELRLKFTRNSYTD